jgi:hypothetical protein
MPSAEVSVAHLIGQLLVDCLRSTEEPLVFQCSDDRVRLTLPGRGSWDGRRFFTHSGRGIQDAALVVLTEASMALAQR